MIRFVTLKGLEMSQIEDIKTVTVVLLQTPVPVIVIAATGEIKMTGWSNFRLSPYFYSVPPTDGVWDFDFLGDDPVGLVAPGVLPVAAMTSVTQ